LESSGEAVACAGNQGLIRDLTMTLFHLFLQLRVGALVPKAPVQVIRKVVCTFETNPTYAEGTSANHELTGRTERTSFSFENCLHIYTLPTRGRDICEAA
jgi:hypothetical protein